MIKILSPGIYSSIQDTGRRGFRRYGMPLSGAMDHYAFTAANYLLGNQPNEASIEITGQGFSCELTEDACVCITGADLGAIIKNRDIKLRIGVPISLQKGDVILFSKIIKGLRAYLQVRGGFERENIMGSKSMLKGERLSTGEFLKKGNCTESEEKGNFNFGYIREDGEYNIRVQKGPDNELYSRNYIKKLMSVNYLVSPYHDRMGIRLKSLDIMLPIERNIITKPVFPGCIQLPDNGNPIIIMNDGQTTGGYPVWAVIVKEDLKIAGQLKSGDKVKFIYD
ncbi:MAG: biotin-dependent carboxyltransferase family protein [Clostridiales bacterium]|nr:biotin-dependent carboxyltransferase family protein [Clostridiales bacterium]